MTSVLIGQIIRIFYKENSPPRGSSRGIKAYEASYFLWRALALVDLLSGDRELHDAPFVEGNDNRVAVVILNDIHDILPQSVICDKHENKGSEALKRVLLVLDSTSQCVDAHQKPSGEDDEDIQRDSIVSEELRRHQGNDPDDERNDKLGRDPPRQKSVIHSSLLSGRSFHSK